MSFFYKTLTHYGSDDGRTIDTGYTYDQSSGFGLNPVDVGVPSDPSGLFAYGSVGSGTAASLGLSTPTLAAPAPTTVSIAGSALTIQITWDTSVASAPSAFMTGVIAAVQAFESNFSNAVTIDIAVGYGEIAGTPMGGGALGESESYLQFVSYASLVAALATHNSDATTAAVLASLPATAPVSGYIWLTTAQAKALGLAAASGTGLDGYIGLANSYAFTYNTSGTVAAGSYDFNGIVSHELTEVLGRLMLTGGSVGSYANSYSLLDLLHYSSPGVRDFSASTPGYFSANRGATNGGAFNTSAGGDAADWASSVGNNAFDAFSNSGVINPVTSDDVTEMNAIGWTLNKVNTPPTNSVIEAYGAIALWQVGAEYVIHSATANVALQFGGAPVTAGQFDTWVPIAAEAITGGYEVAWKHGAANQFTAWTTDSSGAWTSFLVNTATGTDPSLEGLEPSFQQDLNGDGTIGLKANQVIESAGSTSLWQVGAEYFLHGATANVA